MHPRPTFTCPQVPELGSNARAYEGRAARYLSKYNVGVVDVGIANIEYPATSLQLVRQCAYVAVFSRLGTHHRISCRLTAILPELL
jgi:hypothetical protein